jgi:hypothetical protein
MTKRNIKTKSGLQSAKGITEFSNELTADKNKTVEKTSPK